jgi:NAD(P)-dependent dehydrogenase (short-subunit alcohol dehydrogenase family)
VSAVPEERPAKPDASRRTVLVTGATGVTGRAVCALLTARGDTVLAVGTDAERLQTVDAAEHFVADMTSRAATDALAADVATRHTAIDGILHLVGGWKPGWGDEVTDWLNARLVNSLLYVSEAFEGMLLAAPAGRLAIISSTVVTHDGPPSSAYAAAKLAAESWVSQLNARWAGTPAGAVTYVVRSIGDGEKATAPDAVAAALADVWAEAPGARVLL